MNRQEAREQYGRALKAGQKYFRACVIGGKYPYPQALEEIFEESTSAGRVDLGLLEVPTEQIVGTTAAGRRSAFAGNFMPLLPVDSEFGSKWVELCAAHLGDEGIRDPIRCFEYLGRFYVQEGNKRVSVLKSYGAPTVPGYVTRLIPAYSQEPEIQSYYEFMQFYRRAGLYQVSFDKPGGYARLQAALGYDAEHVWTEEERRSFLAGFLYFRELFCRTGGESLPVTVSDALLEWLQVYPFSDLKEKTAPELEKSLTAIWPDIRALAQDNPIAVSVEPVETDKGILTRLFGTRPSHLNVAFVNAASPAESAWTQGHEQGRQYLEQALGDRVTVRVYNGIPAGSSADEVMEKAVEEGAQVLFATTPPLIGACRKIAARYPGVRVLNCSLSMPYPGVRTYYSRLYEGKFITGAIAGAVAQGEKIGYVADYPIFGVPASINAFALGMKLTNPRARVQLLWSCVPGDPARTFAEQGVRVVSSRDVTTPERTWWAWDWGVYQMLDDGILQPLASPCWEWGKFYEQVILSIFGGGWDALGSKEADKAVNYWWGMDSGVIDVQLRAALPAGVRRLAEILRDGISNRELDPFRCVIRDQNGVMRSDGSRGFTPEEIINMDWLCDCVDGSIPPYEELLPISRSMVRLLGIYRDQIPPEKEGAAL